MEMEKIVLPNRAIKSISGLVDSINNNPLNLLDELGVKEYSDITNENGLLDYFEVEEICNLIEEKKKFEENKYPVPTQSKIENKFLFFLKDYMENTYFEFPETDADEFDLIEFYSEFLKKELNLDIEEVENLFRKEFEFDLLSFFIENFKGNNLWIFFAFLYSYIVEKEPFILFTSPYSNGNYNGEVMNVYVRGSCSQDFKNSVVKKFVDFIQHKSIFSSFYYEAYRRNENINLNSVDIDAKNTNVLNSVSNDFYNSCSIGQFVPLVGNRVPQEAIVFQVNSDHVQNIYPFGAYIENDQLRFIGVCANKPKSAPSSSDKFSVKTETESNNIFRKYTLAHFQRLFVNFPNYIKNLKDVVYEANIYWNAIQHFFWLLTQPHNEPRAFLHYFTPVDNSNMDLMNMFRQLMRRLGDDEINEKSKELTSYFANYMLSSKIPIYHRNLRTFSELIKYSSSEINKYEFYELQHYCLQKPMMN